MAAAKKKLTNYQQVVEFHKTFGQPVAANVTIMTESRMNLRNGFIMEEYNELLEAQGFVEKPTLLQRIVKKLFPSFFEIKMVKERSQNIVEIADALTDILYFVYGQGIEHGFDMDACFAEVHRSNMSKLDENGKVLYRDDGKVMKSSLYSAPDLVKVLFP